MAQDEERNECVQLPCIEFLRFDEDLDDEIEQSDNDDNDNSAEDAFDSEEVASE